MFFTFLYYPEKNSTENVNLERINAFTTTPNCNLRLFPFSRPVLFKLLKVVTLQSGWEWKKKCDTRRSSIVCSMIQYPVLVD